MEPAPSGVPSAQRAGDAGHHRPAPQAEAGEALEVFQGLVLRDRQQVA